MVIIATVQAVLHIERDILLRESLLQCKGDWGKMSDGMGGA
jgi:hypothetical protein